MRILVVGSGGREHALCRRMAADPSVTALACAPGNAGTLALADSLPVDVADPEAVADVAADWGADLVVVGPELPLVAGAADALRARLIPCFGPSAAAARIEGSKAFAKDVMLAAGVPTAEARVCTGATEAAAALDRLGPPYVVKDDGLAAGKGVVVTNDRAAALAHAEACERVVVERYLDGPELSLFCVTDGTTVLPLLPAQDYKRVGDGDTGPNTGGMGAYAPLPWAPAGLVDEVVRTVVQPTVDEMRRRGTPFTGLLYAGLALTSTGVRVVEFNARFGDPETQAVLALLDSSLVSLLNAAAQGKLSDVAPLVWRPGAAVTVVVAAEGYPDSPVTGGVLDGIEDAEKIEGAHVLHAGTLLHESGEVVSAGGRVLSATAVGDDVAHARTRAYEAVGCIRLRGSHHRTDIAARFPRLV